MSKQTAKKADAKSASVSTETKSDAADAKAKANEAKQTAKTAADEAKQITADAKAKADEAKQTAKAAADEAKRIADEAKAKAAEAKAKLDELKAAELEAKQQQAIKDAESVDVCNTIAKRENDMATLMRANSKVDQAAIWMFNAWTDTDFLIERESHAELISKFEAASKALDELDAATKSYVETVTNEVRTLHQANAEVINSSVMTKQRKLISSSSKQQMQSIVDAVNGEAESEASEAETSDTQKPAKRATKKAA